MPLERELEAEGSVDFPLVGLPWPGGILIGVRHRARPAESEGRPQGETVAQEVAHAESPVEARQAQVRQPAELEQHLPRARPRGHLGGPRAAGRQHGNEGEDQQCRQPFHDLALHRLSP